MRRCRHQHEGRCRRPNRNASRHRRRGSVREADVCRSLSPEAGSEEWENQEKAEPAQFNQASNMRGRSKHQPTTSKGHEREPVRQKCDTQRGTVVEEAAVTKPYASAASQTTQPAGNHTSGEDRRYEQAVRERCAARTRRETME